MELLLFLIWQSKYIFKYASKDTFEAVDDWINDARENGKSDLDIIVVGNKLDLQAER